MSRTFPFCDLLGATEQPKSTISKRRPSCDFQADCTPSHLADLLFWQPPILMLRVRSRVRRGCSAGKLLWCHLMALCQLRRFHSFFYGVRTGGHYNTMLSANDCLNPYHMMDLPSSGKWKHVSQIVFTSSKLLGIQHTEEDIVLPHKVKQHVERSKEQREFYKSITEHQRQLQDTEKELG